MSLKSLDLNKELLTLISQEFTGLYSGGLKLSSIEGGQSAANAALEALDITRYAEGLYSCSTVSEYWGIPANKQ